MPPMAILTGLVIGGVLVWLMVVRNRRRRAALGRRATSGGGVLPQPPAHPMTTHSVRGFFIYQKPRRGRYKVYCVCEAGGKGGPARRTTVDEQPFHGFSTVDAAISFLDRLLADPIRREVEAGYARLVPAARASPAPIDWCRHPRRS